MKKFIKNNLLILLIGICSLILPILDRSFFSVVSEHPYFYTILAGIVFVISSLIAIVLPTLITNLKFFENNYIKFIALIPSIFLILLLIIPLEWAKPEVVNILNTIFEISFFPIIIIIDFLYFLAPFIFLLIVLLAPYLFLKYVQKPKSRFIEILYLILYTYLNWIITISIWAIVYFE